MKNKKLDATQRTKVGKELDFASREAYNLLRTNISFAFPDQKGGKVIGITSTSPQDGKSKTSINLAYSLAESGKRVLLIDGDMRRPSVCTTLELPMEPGLSEVLSGGIEETPVHKSVLQENMDVLLSGRIPPNPSELIGSHGMEALLEKCKEIYDYVILDMPPVMSVSDPVVASRYISGMIIVVRHEKTGKRELAETIRQLEYVNVKMLGFVYNRFGQRKRKKSRKNSKYNYESKK